jgi:hypothetical protein
MQVRNQIEAAKKRASGPSILAGTVSFLFGGGTLAIAIWGIWASRSISRSYGSQPMVASLTYLVLFAPFAVVGSLFLWAGWNKATGNWPRRTLRQLLDALAGLFIAEPQHSLEPLDERTKQRLDAASTSFAKMLGVAAGAVLILLGIVGFVAETVAFYGSASHSGWYPTRLQMTFAIACGLAIVGGAIIVRDTFRKADQSWLVPLKIFTAVVSARVASDQARMVQEKPLLDAPQTDRNNDADWDS